MEVQFFCPRWGSEQLSWDTFCQKVREAGFDGVETPLSFDEKEKDELRKALDTHGLFLIGQYYQSFERDFVTHVENYKKHLINLATLNPLKIDAQTGKDYFTFEQNAALVTVAAEFSQQTGIAVAHETHRNKALFAAHVTHNYLQRIPELSITADFSHWCAVAESLLDDQPEAVALASERTIHIHARVGHQEGPQVTDPRAPEWAVQVDTHMGWWKNIIEDNRKKGTAVVTITPEFGPAPYMPALPYTQMPVASQWDINVYMMNLIKQTLL